MNTVTKSAPRRQRKPLVPVNISANLTGSKDPGGLVSDLLHGCAILDIVTIDTNLVTQYWTRIVRDDSGEPTAIELKKFGEAKFVTVSLDSETCDCEDATYRANSPGGCKHVVALRQTLPAVAAAGKAVA